MLIWAQSEAATTLTLRIFRQLSDDSTVNGSLLRMPANRKTNKILVLGGIRQWRFLASRLSLMVLRHNMPTTPPLSGMVPLMNSQLSRCWIARGSYSKFSLVGPTKVKARKSFLLTEKFPCIENKEHLLDFVITFIFHLCCFNTLCSGMSQSTFSWEWENHFSNVRITEVFDQNVSKNNKNCHICSMKLKSFLLLSKICDYVCEYSFHSTYVLGDVQLTKYF